MENLAQIQVTFSWKLLEVKFQQHGLNFINIRGVKSFKIWSVIIFQL